MTELNPDQQPHSWSEISGVYERAFEKLTTQFSDEALRQLELKPGEKVLDVAAGTGAFSLAAARQGGDVLATDFAEGMINRLQQRIDAEGLDNIQAQVMDGQKLALDDDSQHVAASIVGVIFFSDIAKGFAELKRVLKPKGRCAVVCWSDPDKFEMMTYLKRAIQIAASDFKIPEQTPVWARLTGSEHLEKEMQTAGFSNIKVSNMTATLVMDSPQEFWRDFTSSAPPLARLFGALGEEKTRKTGEVFTELIMHDCRDGAPSFSAEACIAIGEA